MPFDGGWKINQTPELKVKGFFSRFFSRSEPVKIRVMPTICFNPASPADTPETNAYLPVRALELGRTLIEDRANWVQKRYETRDGRRCAVGALRAAARVLRVRDGQPGHIYLLNVAMNRGFNDVESMNDNSSHRQVVSAFDEALLAAQAAKLAAH